MKTKVNFSKAASEDVRVAAAWYREQGVKLKARFLNALQQTVDILKENPRLYPQVYRETRQALLKSFPYSVLYRMEPNSITVIAVYHQSRNPREWMARLP